MKKQLNTEIIAVGTELLLGQIANTNAQWISKQLARYGINTFYHTVVGDNFNRLTEVLKQAKERSNVIIITGGLGPTEDDLSREAFQEISRIPMTIDEVAMKKIEQYYEKQNVTMTPNNKRQARVFQHSIVLENKVGMAPGNIVQYDNTYWIFLPGVPREMKQIFTDSVIPFLRKLNGDTIIYSNVLKFIGIGESVLEDTLQDLIEKQHNPTIALLAGRDGVTIRLTVKATSEQEAKEKLQATKNIILERAGDYCFGENDMTIEEKVFQLLEKRNKQLAAAESLTGGLFSDRLVALPGASSVFKGSIVCYDTEVKEKVLGVRKETIEKDGTVSYECAKQMAENVAKRLNTSIGISFTGVAGPSKTEGKDVGTVYVALYDQNGYCHVEKCFFQGDRYQIRYRSVLKGYELLFKYLK